jgi:hypothetical protein
MTNREQIMRLRGNEIQKVLCEVSTKDGVLALVGFGYSIILNRLISLCH